MARGWGHCSSGWKWWVFHFLFGCQRGKELNPFWSWVSRCTALLLPESVAFVHSGNSFSRCLARSQTWAKCLPLLLWQEANRPCGLLMSPSVIFSRCCFPDPIQGAVLQAHLRQSQRECWPCVFLWVACWLHCASKLDKSCCHYRISGPLTFARQDWMGSWAISHVGFREAWNSCLLLV